MKNKIFEKIINTFNMSELQTVCKMNGNELMKLVQLMPKTIRPVYFKNNNSPVLGVAHLDSVQKSEYCQLINHPAGQILFCPKADDRISWE
jgi:hypothetical protein